MEHQEYSEATAQPVRATVLIVDPFVEKTATMEKALRALGCHVLTSSTLSEAMSTFERMRPTHVLTELRFSDGSALDFVRWALSVDRTTRVVVHTWFADVPIAVAATKAGAHDLVPKPTDEEFLANILLLGSTNIPQECRIEEPDRLRQQHIEHVMRSSRANVSLAAKKLLLHRRSLQRLLKRQNHHL
jgi:two-component system response regulator RegA